MELFIITDKIPMSILKVSLKDGHTPMIKNFSPIDSETGPGYCNHEAIEPAVWFKVMVVDSISIDCTKREILWNNDRSLPHKGSTEAGQRFGRKKNPCRVAESMYNRGELYKFESDLDELFDNIQVAVVDFASSRTSRDEFNSEVMRMLHCHVLPLIKLTKVDIPKMKEVYADEEKYIKDIEEAIIGKDKQMESIAKAMHRQRKILLSSFVNMDKNDQSSLTVSAQTCNKELAQVLVADCESDMYELDQQLNNLQREVDEVKKALEAQEGRDGREQCRQMETLVSSEEKIILLKQLREKRDERNECHGKLNEVLSARENLKVYISETEELEEKQRSKSFLKYFKGSPELQPLLIHNIYIGMRDTLNEMKEKVEDLVRQKVMVLSVKEALRRTLEELEVKEETLGLDVGVMDGLCSTNVLRKSRKPQKWRSLREKVSDLLSNPKSQAGMKHSSFVKSVTDCCQAAILANRNQTGLNSEISLRSDVRCGQKTRKSSGYTNHLEPSSPGCGSSRAAMWHDDAVGKTGCKPCVHVEEQRGGQGVVHNSNCRNGHDLLRQAIDELKPQIQRHFSEMCELIQTSIETHSQTATKMVLQCYEHHFYKANNEHLLELYKKAFNSNTNRLQLVFHLTLKDIGLDNSVIMGMLQEKTVSMPQSSHSDPDATPMINDNREPSSFLGRLSTQAVEDVTEIQPTAATESHSLQWIENHYSQSANVVYSQQSLPQAPLTDISENLEDGFNAMQLYKKDASTHKKRRLGSSRQRLFQTNNSAPENKNPSFAYRDVNLNAEFQEKLSIAKDCLKETLEGWTPIKKLQSLMKCLHEVTNCWSEYQLQYNNKEVGACSDVAIDMLVILLLNCEAALTASLYPHVQFLADMLPPVYEGGQYDYCLTQFSCAYQFLQDKLQDKYGSYIK